MTVAAIRVQSTWTKTFGAVTRPLEEDFQEECERIAANVTHFRLPEVEITPQLVRCAMDYIMGEVGDDVEFVKSLTIRDAVDQYLE